jgi:hypothetical protein
MVNWMRDRSATRKRHRLALVPPTHVQDFADAARVAGDTVEVTVVPESGHFELVAASSAAWPRVEKVFRHAMRA